MNTKETLSAIRDSVHQILPDAKVMLFGSRANDTAHEESDWDILVIDKAPVDGVLKLSVRHHLYPLSLKLLAFFHTTVVSEDDWNNNPTYYSLRQSVLSNPHMS